MKKLLLLHGALGASSQFDELKKILDSDFEIFTLDFEGHGNSQMKDRTFRIQHFAENVLEFLDENKIESIDIFGYSMGGHVALSLASQFSERIKSVFTIATKFHWDEATALREAKFLNAEKMQEKVPHFVQQLKNRHGDKWKLLLEKSAEQMLSMPATNPLTDEALKKISCRTRISVGDKDQMVTIEETLKTYRLIQNAELQIFPGMIHPFEKINFKLLSNAIGEFFNGNTQ